MYRETLPQRSQIVFRSIELVAIAVADAVDRVWLWSNVAVRVLPHGPRRPVCRHDRRWTILREPQPALREPRIFSATEQLFDVTARIEAGKTARRLVDLRYDRARLCERHARAARILFEVEDQQRVVGRSNELEKEIGRAHV